MNDMKTKWGPYSATTSSKPGSCSLFLYLNSKIHHDMKIVYSGGAIDLPRKWPCMHTGKQRDLYSEASSLKVRGQQGIVGICVTPRVTLPFHGLTARRESFLLGGAGVACVRTRGRGPTRGLTSCVPLQNAVTLARGRGLSLHFGPWLPWDWTLLFLIRTRAQHPGPTCTAASTTPARRDPAWCLQTLLPLWGVMLIGWKERQWVARASTLHSGLANTGPRFILKTTLRVDGVRPFARSGKWDAAGYHSGSPPIRQLGSGREEAGTQDFFHLNSGLLNYSLHPKPLWFGFLITRLRWNRIS